MTKPERVLSDGNLKLTWIATGAVMEYGQAVEQAVLAKLAEQGAHHVRSDV